MRLHDEGTSIVHDANGRARYCTFGEALVGTGIDDNTSPYLALSDYLARATTNAIGLSAGRRRRTRGTRHSEVVGERHSAIGAFLSIERPSPARDRRKKTLRSSGSPLTGPSSVLNILHSRSFSECQHGVGDLIGGCVGDDCGG